MSSDLVWKGYAIKDTKKWDQFEVVEFEPKQMGERDVDIRIEYCGVCGSDVHTITGGWGSNIILPMITGHEIVGHVAAVGPKVEEFKVGDRVGVGAIVGSCFNCNRCKQGNENYCKKGKVFTYNSKYPNGDIAHGGYSTAIRADERWVVPIPDGIKLEEAAPLLCAGVTVYSPLFENGAGPGKTVGIVGIGGLGHLAVQFARALGADRVVAFSHSDKKKEDAFAMGATDFVATAEKGWEKVWEDQVDLIINTVDVSSAVAIDQLLSTLTVHGKHIMVSLPDDALPEFKPNSFISNAAYFGGSLVGSKKEAIDMFKLAVEKNVRPVIQVMPMKEAGQAIRNVKDGSVRYRTVLKVDIPGSSKL